MLSYRPSPSIHERLSWHALPVFLITRCRSITTEEWRSGIEFLTRMGETSITRGQLEQFNHFSNVFGVTALVERINNPRVGNATESSLLGPFFTEDAPDRAWTLQSLDLADPHHHLRLTCSLVRRVDRV